MSRIYEIVNNTFTIENIELQKLFRQALRLHRVTYWQDGNDFHVADRFKAEKLMRSTMHNFLPNPRPHNIELWKDGYSDGYAERQPAILQKRNRVYMEGYLAGEQDAQLVQRTRQQNRIITGNPDRRWSISDWIRAFENGQVEYDDLPMQVINALDDNGMKQGMEIHDNPDRYKVIFLNEGENDDSDDGGDDRLLVSYLTPVAAYINGQYYVTNVRYSQSTQRHISKFVRHNTVESKPQSFFNNLYNSEHLPQSYHKFMGKLPLKTYNNPPDINEMGDYLALKSLGATPSPKTQKSLVDFVLGGASVKSNPTISNEHVVNAFFNGKSSRNANNLTSVQMTLRNKQKITALISGGEFKIVIAIRAEKDGQVVYYLNELSPNVVHKKALVNALESTNADSIKTITNVEMTNLLQGSK